MKLAGTLPIQRNRPHRAITTARELTERLQAAPVASRSALTDRLRTLLIALDNPPPAGLGECVRDLEALLAAARADTTWLSLAVLGARLPDPPSVLRAIRRIQLDGPIAALDEAVFARALAADARTQWRDVEIARDAVVVDVHHTFVTPLATGVQRVTREAVRRWHRDHDLVLTGWHISTPAFTRFSAEQADRALHGTGLEAGVIEPSQPVLVPWRSTYLLPEVQADVNVGDHLQAFLNFSGNRSGAIGHDCIPLTTAETIIDGMGNGFASGLAALAHADRIAATSRGSATEYRGWRSMLGGTGLSGPEIAEIELPAAAEQSTPLELAKAREAMIITELPMVLVVGSHEPRKNHLAVLHAAELLWREGQRFSLVFIGGSSWNSESFYQRLGALQGAGRPVHSLTAVPDERVWAAYRLARCTVFPSLNEGFGLPVAESLAAGTPVITSNFGSMQEIAEDGGALLIDPRDDHAIADGLRKLLTDDRLHAELSRQARQRPTRSWDDYAEQTWTFLVEGT